MPDSVNGPPINNGKKTEHRITAVEVMQGMLAKDFEVVQKDVKSIMENHLPHIKEEVASLNRLMKFIGGSLGAGILVNIVINWIR